MARKLLYGTLISLAALATALPAAAETAAMTADQVVAKNIEARGGAKTIADMQSIRITGKRTMGPGMEAPFTLTWKRPGKMRLEFEFQGQKGIQAFDGETAWMNMPFMGQTGPEKMPEEMASQIRDQADFEGPLVDYKKKGHAVVYAGVVDVDGSPAHKLEVTKKNGDEITYYLDADAFLEIKTESSQEMNGQPVDVAIGFSDYKEVGGLMFAHAMEISMDVPGMPGPQQIVMDSVEVDVDAPDAMFSMPAAEPAAKPGQ